MPASKPPQTVTFFSVGVAGWTGIVPAKARPMATRMVRMVTTSLIDVNQVAGRIEAAQIVKLFQPYVPTAVQDAARSAGGVSPPCLPLVLSRRRVSSLPEACLLSLLPAAFALSASLLPATCLPLTHICCLLPLLRCPLLPCPLLPCHLARRPLGKPRTTSREVAGRAHSLARAYGSECAADGPTHALPDGPVGP